MSLGLQLKMKWKIRNEGMDFPRIRALLGVGWIEADRFFIGNTATNTFFRTLHIGARLFEVAYHV